MKTNRFLLALNLFFFTPLAYAFSSTGPQAYALGDSLVSVGDYSGARTQYEIAIHYFQINGVQDSLLETIGKVGRTFSSERDYSGLIMYVEPAISGLVPANEKTSYSLAYLYNLLGFAKKKLLQYAAALEAYENALRIFEQNKANGPNVAYTYRQAAQIYMRRLDYAKTTDYLKRGLKSDSTNAFESTFYTHLAMAEQFLDNKDQALEYYKKAMQLPFKHLNEKAATLTVGASIYVKKGVLDTARILCREALAIFSKEEGSWASKLEIYLSLAKIAAKQGKETEANQYFQKALEQSDEYPVKKRETAGLYADWGKFHLDHGNLDQALSYFQKALIQVIPNLNSTNLNISPSIESLYPEPWIMTAAALKGEALRIQYEQSQNIQDLKIAGESYLLALATIDILKSTYGTEKARLYIGDYGNQYYEEAIGVFYQLHKQTDDVAYLGQIFQLMERSKAAILKEARQQHKAILLAAIPDSILKREEALRSDIAAIKKILAFEKLLEIEKDQETIHELEAKLNRLEEANTDFLTQLENKYPKYRTLISNATTPKLEIVQQGLPQSGQVVLEYFWGSESAYLLWMTSDQADVFQIEDFQQLSSDLEELLSLLRHGNKLLKSPEQFNTLSYSTYNALGFRTIPLQSVDKLLIIPDGQLHYLPFDVLLTEVAPAISSFECSYLIKNHATSYAYTASNIPVSEIASGNQRFLKIAPGFSKSERGLVPLRFSEFETGKLKPDVKLSTTQAKAKTFLSHVGDFNLIHLSTHAEANPADALPHIEFIDTALYLPEIYAMKLQADLVVLSACETGMGELAKGEGVMSLARGFLFAGASSLVSSLWKVNERSTATIFGNFYDHLENGKSKSEALREAKIQYLEEVESDLQKAPYYWAGFTLTGQDGMVRLPKQSFAYNRFLIFIFFGILLVLLGKKYWSSIHQLSEVH